MNVQRPNHCIEADRLEEVGACWEEVALERLLGLTAADGEPDTPGQDHAVAQHRLFDMDMSQDRIIVRLYQGNPHQWHRWSWTKRSGWTSARYCKHTHELPEKPSDNPPLKRLRELVEQAVLKATQEI